MPLTGMSAVKGDNKVGSIISDLFDVVRAKGGCHTSGSPSRLQRLFVEIGGAERAALRRGRCSRRGRAAAWRSGPTTTPTIQFHPSFFCSSQSLEIHQITMSGSKRQEKPLNSLAAGAVAGAIEGFGELVPLK